MNTEFRTKSKKRIHALITASGSPLSQSVHKALQQSKLPLDITLSDISDMAAGFYIFENSPTAILPMVSEPQYFDAVTRLVDERQIDVVFPMLSVEHQFFHKHQDYFKKRGVAIVSSAEEAYRLCNDKLDSMTYLRDAGITCPDTVLGEPGAKLNEFVSRNKFPLLIKPIAGASSNDVYVIKDRVRLDAMLSAFPAGHFVVQEFLPSKEEYTVGVYVSRERDFIDTLVLQRELKFGLSYRGKVIENDAVSEYCKSVCLKLGTSYSANVQLKIEKGTPYVFEINPRLSSTTSVRAHFGFNEPEMILTELFADIRSYTYQKTTGRFTRFWQEAYLPS